MEKSWKPTINRIDELRKLERISEVNTEAGEGMEEHVGFVCKSHASVQRICGKEVNLAARPACKKVKIMPLKSFKHSVLVEE